MFGVEKLEEEVLKLGHLVKGHVLEQTLGAAEDYGYFVLYCHGAVLGLNEQALVLTALVDYAGGHRVDITTELGE